MRVFVLTAFFALQLSVFTCGFDMHVHVLDSDSGQSVQAQTHVVNYDVADADHGCHVHTSHTLIELDAASVDEATLISFAQYHVLPEPNLKKIPFSIEYPPKAHYG